MVSFVIPAHNEERYITAAIDSIRAAVGLSFLYEVIVVDNGSSDQTARLAAECGAKVLRLERGMISAARNAGAAIARGDYLVFMDGDVTLTPAWMSAFRTATAEMDGHPLTVSGSLCGVPTGASWLERVWFSPRIERTPGYLGGAHIILRRETFERIGGFDEALETGEDYDLCARLLAQGGTLFPLSTSVAIHHGYPRTLSGFVRREVWHGTGDCGSLSAVLSSRVALTALAFFGLHVIGAIGLLTMSGAVFAASAACIVAICLLSAWRSIPYRSAGLIAANAVLYYAYFMSRVFSFIRAWSVRRAASASFAASARSQGG